MSKLTLGTHPFLLGFDQLERLLERTANPVLPAWTGFKVRWEMDHHPEAYARTAWYLVPKDFINYRLTGEITAAYVETGQVDTELVRDVGQPYRVRGCHEQRITLLARRETRQHFQ